MPAPIGTRLGPYEILAPLGAGGMGEVYRALDTRLGREIALKILPQELSRDNSMRVRFEQEARAVSALNHPNIVCIHDIGQENDVLYIVCELVDGEPLRSVISRGPSPARKIIDIGKQIADGLAAAHSAGIVHRDLKPENILLTRDGRVKIIDFGLAKQLFQGSAATVTMPGAVMGTIGYMSPEQIRGQSVDSRTDIFSLGVILYELAAGKSAFTGGSGADVMSAILREEPAELPSADMPPALPFIIHRCLQKDPAARFQNASDLAFAISSPSSVPAAQVTQVTQVTKVTQVTRPKRSLAWMAWVVPAFLIAAGAGYWVFLRPQPKPAVPAAQTATVIPAPAPEPAKTPIPTRQEKATKPPAKVVVPPEPPKPVAESPEAKERPNRALERAQQLNQAGKYDEALAAFDEAIRLRPQFPLAFLGRGRAFVHQEKYDRALADFTEAIRLKPDLVFAFVDRGHLYNRQGEYQRAIQDFDEAVRLNPDAIKAYEGRAVSKFRLGDRKGAAADRKLAVQVRKDKR